MPIPFEVWSVIKDKGPLNKFLVDSDTGLVLKKCYSKSTKAELTENADIMEGFFGSATSGTAFMNSISDLTWNFT